METMTSRPITRGRSQPTVSLAIALLHLFIFSLVHGLKDPLDGSSAPFSSSSSSSGGGAQCFCQLEGRIDDCLCSVDTVDHFNNMKIYPRLQSLLSKPYFRYFWYNARRRCPFWDDSSGKCASENCGVRPCQDEEIPPGLKGSAPGAKRQQQQQQQQQQQDCPTRDDGEQQLNGAVDGHISDEARLAFSDWRYHDDASSSPSLGEEEEETDFCAVDAELCPDCDAVDLTLNPERFTGYSGEASRSVWRAIYEENCFRPPGAPSGATFADAFLQV